MSELATKNGADIKKNILLKAKIYELVHFFKDFIHYLQELLDQTFEWFSAFCNSAKNGRAAMIFLFWWGLRCVSWKNPFLPYANPDMAELGWAYCMRMRKLVSAVWIASKTEIINLVTKSNIPYGTNSIRPAARATLLSNSINLVCIKRPRRSRWTIP